MFHALKDFPAFWISETGRAHSYSTSGNCHIFAFLAFLAGMVWGHGLVSNSQTQSYQTESEAKDAEKQVLHESFLWWQWCLLVAGPPRFRLKWLRLMPSSCAWWVQPWFFSSSLLCGMAVAVVSGYLTVFLWPLWWSVKYSLCLSYMPCYWNQLELCCLQLWALMFIHKYQHFLCSNCCVGYGELFIYIP